MQIKNFKKINISYRIYKPSLDVLQSSPAVPLVFLHGLMGYASNWGKIWPHFQNERPVLVLDQRGHGKSEKPSMGYDPENYAQDLYYLLEELGWQSVHLVGHSMGGRVAMYFAKLFPSYTASLVLEDSGAEARPDRLQWIQNLLATIPTPFLDNETAKNFFAKHFAQDTMLGGFLHSNLERKENGSYDWRFLPSAMVETIEKGRALDAMPLFSSLSVPTLVIRGEWSEEFSQAEAERMRDCRENVRLEVIERAGHFVHPAQPDAFVSALKKFLALAYIPGGPLRPSQ